MASEPESFTYRSQGLKLHYVAWGDENAPLLILLHGARDHARAWDFAARELIEQGWRVIAPDLRGHGDSEWSTDAAYLASYHLLDLADLVSHLATDRFVIVGHSFGGLIGARYAASFPEKVTKLVLVDGMGPGADVKAEWDRIGSPARSRAWIEARHKMASKSPLRFASIEEATQRMAAGNPHLTAEQAGHMARHGVRRDGEGWVWKSDPLMNVFPPEDFLAETPTVFEAIACPVLSFWGDRSYLAHPDSDGRVSRLKDGRLAVYEGAGHWLHQERPEQFLGDLLAFLGAPSVQID